MKSFLPIIFTLILISSCTEDILIRVENTSTVDFKEILVSSGSAPVEYGDIAAGGRSDYKEFESAYRYGYVNLLANGKELRIQPFDYVGETPLSKGYYSYQLNLDTSDPENPLLTMELIRVN